MLSCATAGPSSSWRPRIEGLLELELGLRLKGALSLRLLLLDLDRLDLSRPRTLAAPLRHALDCVIVSLEDDLNPPV